jgi:hypothetical protein
MNQVMDPKKSRPSDLLDAASIRAVSVETGSDPRTVKRLLLGYPIRGAKTAERIRLALARRGVKLPRIRWRPPAKQETAVGEP